MFLKVLKIFMIFSIALVGGQSFSGFDLDPNTSDECSRCQDIYSKYSYPSFCGCAKSPGTILHGIVAVPVGSEVILNGCCVGSVKIDPDSNEWNSFKLVQPSKIEDFSK
ncbi:hypothetical protein PVAND_014791 [Polypedilum vanderplanki]|uniref:Uncharacterized protein n=1 Tax=Polypedilum vanderplanki TaxID=319348 RepID=A0A9J6BAS0_POLVA|nr:hypothetical protein PVAND_014791 [Polypedilum vanderplanki]